MEVQSAWARLKLEARRAVGRTLRAAGTRLLTEPSLLKHLEGDDLTRAALTYGVQRHTDKQTRDLVKCRIGQCGVSDRHSMHFVHCEELRADSPPRLGHYNCGGRWVEPPGIREMIGRYEDDEPS